jgi:hypothetical protein
MRLTVYAMDRIRKCIFGRVSKFERLTSEWKHVKEQYATLQVGQVYFENCLRQLGDVLSQFMLHWCQKID